MMDDSIEIDCIDIILPVWNREKFIVRAIESIIKQTYKNWHLIIVDDASKDRTVSEINEFLSFQSSIVYGKIDLIHYETHRGVSFSRNTGLSFSDSKYITFLDSDNWWDKNFLEENLEKLKATNADLVYCLQKVYYLSEDDSKIIGEDVRNSSIPENFFEENKIDLNQIMIRKHVLDKVKGFDESIQRLVDWDFLLRIYGHGFKCVRNEKILSHYMMNYNDSITRTEPGGGNAGRIMRKMKLHPWKLNPKNT